MTALALLTAVAAAVQAQPADSLPEKYVRKVLIEAKWGHGPGEFGKDDHKNEMGLHYGPLYIAADGKGNIYIDDAINGRLQILSPKGEFIAQFNKDSLFGIDKLVVTEDSKIFMLGKVMVEVPYEKSHLITWKYEVRVCDWKGKILNKYRLPDEYFTDCIPEHMKRAKNQPPKAAVQEFGRPLNLRIAGENIILGNKVIASKLKGFLGASGYVYEKYPKKDGGSFGYFATDIYGNDYFGFTQISKYNPQGKLVAVINVLDSCIYGAVLPRYVDLLGNIYAMENDKSGLRVIKYEKQ